MRRRASESALTGAAGYCSNSAGAGAAVGKVQIATSPQTSPGFHPIRGDIKIRAGQIPAGSYDVWLVNLYRNDAGEVVGCAASQLANPLTARSGPPAPGYGSAPALVDVP